MLCSRCHKNNAIVFVTKVEGETKKNEGFCLPCAKEIGNFPLDDIIKQMGIGEQEFEDMSKEFME